MPIFFVTIGPALALVARQSEWHSHRHQASLKSQVGGPTFLPGQTTPPDNRHDPERNPRDHGNSSRPL
jgi:hypothetical protein